MSDLTINTWTNQEKGAFHNFKPEIAQLLEESWCRALMWTLRMGLQKDSKAEVVLPWGTYTATMISKGESGNVTPAWEPSKGFMELLNGEFANPKDAISATNQETFDPIFEELFVDWATYGRMFPIGTKAADKDKDAKRKGVRMTPDEVNYFLNGYTMVLATIAKDKQRDGKIFSLEINTGFPHGRFDFEYDDDKITPTFVADKVFKQMLKDDAAAMAAGEHDFSPIAAGEVRKDVVPVEGEAAE